MVNTEIRLIIFFAAKDGEALHSQQQQDQELTVEFRRVLFRSHELPDVQAGFRKGRGTRDQIANIR